MKAFLSIISLLTAPVIVSTVQAAETAPAALSGYDFTVGTQFKLGYAVSPGFTPEFADMQKALIEKLNKLDEAKIKAFVESYNPTMLIPYSADLWDSVEAYDKYKAEWKKATLQAQAQVALSLQKAGEKTWRFNAVAIDPNTRREAPVTLSALTYNPDSNTWTSAHGELKPTEYKVTDDCVFGAQIGTEWKLEKQDSFAKTTQILRVSKTTDGKAVFVVYALSEVSVTTGRPLNQGGYTLVFPIQQAKLDIGTPGSR